MKLPFILKVLPEKKRKIVLSERKTIDEESWVGVPREWGLKQSWINHVVVDNTTFVPIEWPPITVEKYWKGQEESIKEIVNVFRGGTNGALLEAPCGAGKTLMALDVAARLKTTVLVVVHKEDLARQWRKTLRDCFPSARMGHCQGSKWSYKAKHMVTATAQTLYSRRHRIKEDFLNAFGLVIYDEGHRYPAETFEKVLRMMPCAHRLGVSATWRRKDGLECIWHWHVGRVESRTYSNRLVGDYLQIPWGTSLSDSMFKSGKRLSHPKWLNAIASNHSYNAWLAKELSSSAEHGRKVLCVSDRISHLTELKNRIIKKGKPISVGLYVGAIDKKKVSMEELEAAKKCDIILASYGMMAEGTDIPALDTLFIGTPRVDVEQVVGRIQRHKDGKKRLLVVDPVFQTPYMIALGVKRNKIYRKLSFTNFKERPK